MDAAREAAAGEERLELVAGDIADRRLGLDDETHERLTSGVTHVFHLAAIYNLAVPLAVATRVNVGGTGNVLDLCLAADRLERLAYVSTAYVAGTRTGVVYEHELLMGQGFKNHYESTKFQAEVWIREMMDRVPTTILRPAIVVGDSRTGETQKFDGPYYILRTIARMERSGRPIPQFGRSEALFNVVPVDYIVAAIAAAPSTRRPNGETLHLTDPEPLLSQELFEALSQEYAGREPALSDRTQPGGGVASPRARPRGLRGHPARIGGLPQPPGRLRRPARHRAPDAPWPPSAPFPRLCWCDGGVLPPPRGRPGARRQAEGTHDGLDDRRHTPTSWTGGQPARTAHGRGHRGQRRPRPGDRPRAGRRRAPT